MDPQPTAPEIGMLAGGIEWRRSEEPVPYEAAVAEMEARAAAIREGSAAELVWLLEHPPLYTAGTSPCGVAPEVFGHGVTSLARLGVRASMAEVDAALRATFDDVFDADSACPAASAG